MDKIQPQKNKFMEMLTFSKNFLLVFLKKLSPVIRIIYSFAIIIFLFGMIQERWDWALLSFVVLNLLIMFEIADKLTARDELEVASDVQKSLIPDIAPDDKNFETVFYYETAKEVGGDFLDFIQKKDGTYLISIGDISGKGMSAALYMVQVRLLLRYISQVTDNPKCILTELNKNIFDHIKKNLYFSITLAEVTDRVLKICRAGHTPLLHYKASTGTCEAVKQNGMAVGLNNTELFKNSIEEYTINSEINDIFVFYSDGLTETMNSKKEEFGMDRLKELIVRNAGKSAGEIENIITEEIKKFRGYSEVHDDITIIIMKSK